MPRLTLLLVTLLAAASAALGIALNPGKPSAHPGLAPLSASERQALSPAAAVQRYYSLLQSGQDAAAFDLLCPQQQAAQRGSAAFEAAAAAAEPVTSWTADERLEQIVQRRAIEGGEIALGDGHTYPLLVLLEREPEGWTVCTTNRGNVLPYPKGSATGTTTDQQPGTTTI